MSLSIVVRLVERLNDRARVEVTVAPRADGVRLDGVAVELFTEECEAIGHRIVLPLMGALTGAATAQAEVRSPGALPAGAVVVATAWGGEHEARAWCPADPWTAFEAHVRGKRCVAKRESLDDDVILESLTRRQRGALGRTLPWLAVKPACKPCAAHTAPLDVDVGERDPIDDLTDELGLDEQDAELLRDILAGRDGAK